MPVTKLTRYKSERHARRWAKNNKLKVKCVEYVKGGCRVQVARGRGGLHLTLRVDEPPKS